MGACLQFAVSLVSQTCIDCGIEFAVPTGWNDRRLQDHRDFYCPNGHPQHYQGPTPEQKRINELEVQVAAEQRRVQREVSAREWAESQKRSANIRRGKAEAAKKRLEARVNCGVCPHCQRTFKQLAAHMKSKHPETVHVVNGSLK